MDNAAKYVLNLMEERFGPDTKSRMTFSSDTSANIIRQIFSEDVQNVTDFIKINAVTDFEKFYDKLPTDGSIPADFIFADTIPIEKLGIEFKNDQGEIINTKFEVLSRDARNTLIELMLNDISGNNDFTTVACCTVVNKAAGVFQLPFVITKSDLKHMSFVDRICFNPKTPQTKGVTDMLKKLEKVNDANIDKFRNYFGLALDLDLMASFCKMSAIIWFVVNACLLNPMIKETVKATTSVIVEERPKKQEKKNKKSKPPKKKYVRQICIDFNDIDKHAVETTDRTKSKHTIHCPVWYVTGHWREYKSGRKVFIQGYWKGIARGYKNSEPRERDIPNDEVLDNI